MASARNNGSLDCHNIARSSAEQPSQPGAKRGICWIAVQNETNSAAQASPLSEPVRRRPAGSRSHIPGCALKCCLGTRISGKSCSQASQNHRLVASCVYPQIENLEKARRRKVSLNCPQELLQRTDPFHPFTLQPCTNICSPAMQHHLVQDQVPPAELVSSLVHSRRKVEATTLCTRARPRLLGAGGRI